MLFNQLEFIFVFLPITLVGFLIIGKAIEAPAARLLWLAFASLVFYGYWNIKFLPVIGVSIAVNFLFGLAIIKFPKHSQVTFVGAVGANLAALGFYKYANFGIEIINGVAREPFAPLSVTLPLGVSFFTFTQIAYLADVTLGRAYERNFIKYVVFVTYFPHLIAGPILHHREMMPQLNGFKSGLPPERLAIGLTVFAIGLFKKAVIADYLATVADPVFAAAAKSGVSGLDAWGGALAYSLQIYFDFSGYCDMAIGLSFLFGIALPFNFDAPYKSLSIAEFWRRWHITLSRFLRDYVYIPLGGNRLGEARRNCNLLLTMLLGGLWHGAGWTFLAWGGLHGLFLIVNHGWVNMKGRLPALARADETATYRALSLALTQLCVVVAWVYFRADSMSTAHRVLSAMCGLVEPPVSGRFLVSSADFGLIALGYLACLVLPNVNELFRHRHLGLDTYRLLSRSLPRLHWIMHVRWAVATATLFAAAILAILAAGDGTPFLYFQF
jgi:D-alanyl-lipoteichoic acid acyltransferase DltB (MBOAT superfamily)